MSNIYTGIELGTNTIKIITLEKHKNRYSVLVCCSRPSSGIKDGFVVDMKKAANAVKEAFRFASEMLGTNITKVICVIPPKGCHFNSSSGRISVSNPEKIDGEDISRVISDALKERDFSEEEFITSVPINFKVDDVPDISNPKGMHGEVLSTKVIYGTTSKEELYRILEVIKLAGVEVVDLCYTSTGDYYTIKNSHYDKVVGAIINIGEESTNVSVFNRGIQIKNSTFPVGSVHVDKDLSYLFKISSADARKIKESFCVAKASLADKNDTYMVTINGQPREFNQLGTSKVVEARLREILKLAKNEIKNLTNREISYIIITGGLSEIAGLSYLVEEEFSIQARICNIQIVGIRHNKYSSVLGGIQYFDDKLSLRGKTYNMLSSEDIDNVVSISSQKTNEQVVNRVFGHFFDN